MSITVSTLGFPRIGPRRELKSALERFWARKTNAQSLLADAAGLRAAGWARQRSLGVTHIPSNDFSLYDHVLDTSVMVGAIPEIYGWRGGEVSIDTYFAMARGTHSAAEDHDCAPRGTNKDDLPALEMSKWFDTNYHYMVPELSRGQSFVLASSKPLDEFLEAKSLGFNTRPVLLGPVTYLKLGKSKDEGLDPLSLLPGLIPAYAAILRRLVAAGADWVQIDEPALVLDLNDHARRAFETAYGTLSSAVPGLKLLLTTYFGAIGDNLDTALRLPVAGLHLDLVRAPAQLEDVLAKAPTDLVLSLGVVDGRNIWRTDLNAVLDRVEPVVKQRGADKVMLAPSCSLLHVPVDLDLESELDMDLKSWLAFAVQKIRELATLSRALGEGRVAVKDALATSAQTVAARNASPKNHDPAVQKRMAAVSPDMARRHEHFEARRRLQRDRLSLPAFPTTTIGSFPQTDEVRKARAAHVKGTLSDSAYNAFLQKAIEAAVRWQEQIGIDVLVHGEFERNDMVQYFGEQLAGLCRHQAWLGPKLRLALRPSADYLRRCLTATSNDSRMVRLCPVAYDAADEGHAHRPGHHVAMVVRAR
jgi:5-methyltetrahydropteroyltriglutamate--homocysteine methyltransferase